MLFRSISRDHLTGLLQEHGQNLQGLILETDPPSMLEDFAGAEIHLKGPKTGGLHGPGGVSQWKIPAPVKFITCRAARLTTKVTASVQREKSSRVRQLAREIHLSFSCRPRDCVRGCTARKSA